jgi:hypothetical protein
MELLSRSESVLEPWTIGNQSIYGVFLRVFPVELGRNLFIALLAGAGLQTLILFLQKKLDRELSWVWGISLFPVFGILTWKNTYLVWALPLAYGASRKRILWLKVSALLFMLSSQGIAGWDINAILLKYGFLPFCAWALISQLPKRQSV